MRAGARRDCRWPLPEIPAKLAAAESADGSKLIAADYGDFTKGTSNPGDWLYTSTDSGVTWPARDSTKTWLPVALSADGNKLVAAENGGQLCTSTAPYGYTTVGVAGGLWGTATAAVELLYGSADTFYVESHDDQLTTL